MAKEHMIKGFLFQLTLILLLIGVGMVAIFLVGKAENIGVLKNGWQMKDSTGRERTVNLPVYSVVFMPNALTELSIVLPNEFEETKTICAASSLDKANFYLDGELIYQEFDEHNFTIDETPVNRRRLITLPAKSHTKKLSIVYKHSDSKYVGGREEVYFGTRADLLGYIIYSTSLYTAMGLLGVIIGVEIMIFYALWSREKNNASLLYLGLFMILFGIWEYNQESGIFSTWAVNIFANYKFCMIILMLLPIPFFLHIYIEMESRYQKYFRVLIGAILLNSVVGCIGIAVYPRYGGLPQFTEEIEIILIAVSAVYMFLCSSVTIFRLRRKGHPWKTILYSESTGRFMLYVSIIISIVLYVIRRTELIGVIICVGGFLYACLYCYQRINRLIRNAMQAKEAQLAWEESRNELLLSQIQPHFIYNTLTSIRVLIKKSSEQAYNLTSDFSNYLKYNLETIKNQDFISLDGELQNVRTYLSIEQVRFADKFQVVYDIQVKDFMIPAFTIQPLVENAVKHGDFELGGDGLIVIHTFERGEEYIIQIEDNGGGFIPEEVEPKESKSVGLKNIQARLRYLLGTELVIESVLGKGTVIEVKIPKNLRN